MSSRRLCRVRAVSGRHAHARTHVETAAPGPAIRASLMFSSCSWSQMPARARVLHNTRALVPVCPCACLSVTVSVRHSAVAPQTGAGLHWCATVLVHSFTILFCYPPNTALSVQHIVYIHPCHCSPAVETGARRHANVHPHRDWAKREKRQIIPLRLRERKREREREEEIELRVARLGEVKRGGGVNG